MNREGMTVAQAVERWLEGRQARLELSPHTVRSYRDHLKAFTRFAGPDRALADIDEEDFEDWLASMTRVRDGLPLTATTLNTRAATVRAFAGHAARRRWHPFDFTAGVGRARTPQRRPKRVRPDVFRSMLDRADQRERLLLLLGACLGLRRAEICSLRLDDWDRSTDELLVHGKGSRDRVLPVAGEIRDAMAEWVEVRALGLPLRDLALVALNDAGVGTWVMPRARVERWDETAGTIDFPHRGRVRTVQLDEDGRRIMAAYVRSMPGFGQRPGPLFPSAYHRRSGDPMTKATLANVLKVARDRIAAGDLDTGPWFFPGRRRGAPIATRTVSDLIRELGVSDGVHTHRLRHTFASELVEAGVDIGVVRDLLGHASLVTTSIYVTAAPDRMREAVAGRSYLVGG